MNTNRKGGIRKNHRGDARDNHLAKSLKPNNGNQCGNIAERIRSAA